MRLFLYMAGFLSYGFSKSRKFILILVKLMPFFQFIEKEMRILSNS